MSDTKPCGHHPDLLCGCVVFPVRRDEGEAKAFLESLATDCPTCDGKGYVTQDIDRLGRRYINQPVEDREQVCDDCDGSGEGRP
jgi:DnaJ-class molecular chaperone